MSLQELLGALIPVFFCLLLGYLAGRAHSFDAEQASGLSKLALGFALPASLFAGMAALPKPLIVAQFPLAGCLIAVHLGLLLVTNLLLQRVFHVQTTRSIVFAVILATSATPVFGVAVLSPLLGADTIAAVGLVALAINFAVPAAVILFEIDAASGIKQTKQPVSGQVSTQSSPVLAGLKAGLSSPLLWGPVLGVAVAMTGKHLPTLASGSLTFIGSATSGVAVFAVGLTLAAHKMVFSRAVALATVGRISIQSALLFGLAMVFHLHGPILRAALLCCSFPPATTATLLAAKYRSSEAESASVLLIATLLLAVTIPLLLKLS